jgi:hypothetical protein
MTLGGILKHLAFVEQWWFTMVLHGRPPQGIWADVDWDADRDWDWHSARHDTPEELRATYDAEVARSEASLDEALAHGDLDQTARRSRGDGQSRHCAGSCCTWSRSTPGTPGTPTCSGSPSTARWTSESALPARECAHRGP